MPVRLHHICSLFFRRRLRWRSLLARQVVLQKFHRLFVFWTWCFILNLEGHLDMYIYICVYIYLFFVTHNVHNVLQRRLCVQKSCPFKQTKLASPSSLRPNVHQASLAGLQEMCSSWKFSWQLQLSSVQNRGYLLYEGDYTTQLYRDYNKPL